MAIPHRCPICEGRGEVGKRLAKTGSVLVSEKPQRFQCHGCTGTGIIWDQTFQLDVQPAPLTIQPWIPNNITYSNVTNTLKPNTARQHTTGFLQPVEDGVAKCKDCKEPLYMEPAKGCQRASSHMRSVAGM
jgi:hypothetical protein